MGHDEGSHSESKTKSYLVMKARTKEALELARNWWKTKTVPEYVKVLPLKPEELTDFVDLYNRCFLAAPDPFRMLSFEDAQKLNPDGIFVARLWGTLAGFIACFVQKEDQSVYGEITGIGVVPSRRRRGVATALIQRAVEYFIASGAEEVYCEIYEENLPSKLLVMTYGFREIGRREIPVEADTAGYSHDQYPGGKIMRRLGLKPVTGYRLDTRTERDTGDAIPEDE
jgi:ribosomal protein S18 acetylase RimI-like enzyme